MDYLYVLLMIGWGFCSSNRSRGYIWADFRLEKQAALWLVGTYLHDCNPQDLLHIWVITLRKVVSGASIVHQIELWKGQMGPVQIIWTFLVHIFTFLKWKKIFQIFPSPGGVAASVPFPEARSRKGTMRFRRLEGFERTRFRITPSLLDGKDYFLSQVKEVCMRVIKPNWGIEIVSPQRLAIAAEMPYFQPLHKDFIKIVGLWFPWMHTECKICCSTVEMGQN